MTSPDTPQATPFDEEPNSSHVVTPEEYNRKAEGIEQVFDVEIEKKPVAQEKNLYLISQTKNCDYDTYDSAVVCCSSEEEARLTHPGRQSWEKKWDGKASMYDGWCDAEFVTVEKIGIADNDTPVGVICSSFNAG